MDAVQSHHFQSIQFQNSVVVSFLVWLMPVYIMRVLRMFIISF